jgi:hypothetical protein
MQKSLFGGRPLITLVDAHVHLHPGVDPTVALDAAVANFRAAAHDVGRRDWRGVLLLAETAGMDSFCELSRIGARVGSRRWSFEPAAGETISLLARNGNWQLLIVAGRQVATLEGLEVLALATHEHIPDGLDLMSALDVARRISSLVVLPWAVGKWLGHRGRIVRRALMSAGGSIFAGDNGGRPWFWPASAEFDLANRFGRPVLPGSDPLPIPDEERRIGSVGFTLDWELPLRCPAKELCAHLVSAPVGVVRCYGAREKTLRFVRNQLLLRIPALRRPN